MPLGNYTSVADHKALKQKGWVILKKLLAYLWRSYTAFFKVLHILHVYTISIGEFQMHAEKDPTQTDRLHVLIMAT